MSSISSDDTLPQVQAVNLDNPLPRISLDASAYVFHADPILRLGERKVRLYDNDGLLVDTELRHPYSWIDALKEQNCIVTDIHDPRFKKIHGINLRRHKDLVHTQFPQIDIDQFLRRAEVLEEETCLEKGRLFAEVKEVLQGELDSGCILGVHTSSRRVHVEALYKKLGILDFFQSIVCGDEVAEAKPSPLIVHTLLERLHVTSDQAVGFDDGLQSSIAVVRAGVPVCIIPSSKNFGVQDVDGEFQDLYKHYYVGKFRNLFYAHQAISAAN